MKQLSLVGLSLILPLLHLDVMVSMAGEKPTTNLNYSPAHTHQYSEAILMLHWVHRRRKRGGLPGLQHPHAFKWGLSLLPNGPNVMKVAFCLH